MLSDADHAMIELNFVPTLELMALNKVAVTIISVDKTLLNSLLAKFKSVDDWYKSNECTVVERIKNIPLPDSKKYELFAAFKETVIKIQYWKRKNKNRNLFFQFLIEHFDLIKWSPHGDIDDVETAKTLLNLDILDTNLRYFVACYYSLESHIHKLQPYADWRLLSRKLFRKKMVSSIISVYWQLRRNLPECQFYETKFFYRIMYLEALKLKNLGAMKFFFEELSINEMKMVETANLKSFSRVLNGKKAYYSTDLFLFLLPRVRSALEFNRLILQKHAPSILHYFLRWPMQVHFYDVLDQLFFCISEHDFYRLLKDISSKSCSGRMLFDYQRAFRTVWLKGTEYMRRYVFIKVHRNGNPCIMNFLRDDEECRSLVAKILLKKAVRKLKGNMNTQTGGSVSF